MKVKPFSRSLYTCTGCGEKILTLLLFTLFRVLCMSLRRVIWWSNGNFVGFPRIILKIDKNYPRKYNLHFSGERKIWPTRNWNLTINFVAIWGQWALKCLILVYSHSNIILEWIFWHQTYQYLVNWLICRFCHKPEKCNLCFIT